MAETGGRPEGARRLRGPVGLPSVAQDSEPSWPEPGEADGPAGDEAGAGAVITPYRDGPLIVRGNFTLVDPDGVEIDPGRATVALCRCGKSSLKPFCDGSHVRAGFRAPSAPSRPRPATALQEELRLQDDAPEQP